MAVNRTLFEGTVDEKTVYLGPWEVVGTDHRRVLWAGSYQLERLEQFCMFVNNRFFVAIGV